MKRIHDEPTILLKSDRFELLVCYVKWGEYWHSWFLVKLTLCCISDTIVYGYGQNFDFKIRRDIEKFLRSPRLWVGRRYEPILDCLSKTDVKKSSRNKGLNKKNS